MLLNAYYTIRPLSVTCYNKTKILALAVCCLLLVACGNGTDDSTGGDNNGSNTPGAELSIEKTELGGRFKLHGSESTIPTGYQVEQVTYTITDADTGEIVAQKQDTDHTEPLFRYFSPGSYNVEMMLDVRKSNATDEPTTDIANRYQQSSEVTESYATSESFSATDSYTEAELDDDGDCLLICSTYDDDDTKVGCTFDFDHSSCSDIYTLSSEDLLETAQEQNDDIGDDTAMCIRSSGAAGDDSPDCPDETIKGDGGDGGVAQTLTSYSELAGLYTDLYYLLGEKGSSTVVTGVDFSSSTSLDEDGVIVIAGGGGDGGNSSEVERYREYCGGGDGGSGASVSVHTNACQFKKGDSGDNENGDGEGGSGGGSNTDVSKFGGCSGFIAEVAWYAYAGTGNAGGDGKKGFGGLSDSWYNATSLDIYNSYKGAGNGGDGTIKGGDGGGGSGGGEGGYAAGGGGGGSFAMAWSDADSDWCKDDYYTTNSSSYGNVTFIFSTGD